MQWRVRRWSASLPQRVPWQGDQTQGGCWGWAESALYVAAQTGSTGGTGCGGVGIGPSAFPPVEQNLIAPRADAPKRVGALASAACKVLVFTMEMAMYCSRTLVPTCLLPPTQHRKLPHMVTTRIACFMLKWEICQCRSVRLSMSTIQNSAAWQCKLRLC